MNSDNAFGQQVRQRRRALDLTQDELARRVGCAAITLRKIEAGDARPSQQIAERLAMALAIPLDERADFVRQGRAVQPGDHLPAGTLTPQVTSEEIGLEDLSGRAIRGYLLHDKIGAGAFGVVYRATQPLVEREVAVKIILPQYANHPDFIRRFESEAQLVARLEHPHIVPLYDYWRDPGVAYLVMRLLRGGNVQELLQQGALPLETITRIIEQVGSALHAAHRVGVVHRDLKPANVLLDEDGHAYLADFGIAKNLGDPATQTQAGLVIGSPAYMSPEQINADPVRPQADIYSLGVMLYELLTGTRPFLGPTPLDLIQQHLFTPLPPLAANRSGLPEAFDQIIARATAKDPHDRYGDVDQLLVDFHDVLQMGHLRAAPSPALVPIEISNPYKGLRAFEEADAPDFFGREALTQQLLTRLGEGGDLNRFLAVIGPSGSGKSSVVKAGLVPALRRGGLVGSENWFVSEMTPGSHPLEELEAALLRVAVNPPESLLAQLREDRRGLLRAINRTLPAGNDTELVLIIDQFEEVFTLVDDEAERAHLLDSLVAAIMAEQSRVRVIITLRADFVDRPLRYVDFGELVQRRSELVLPLTPDELERAIVGPADRVGLQLESGLPEAISADVIEQPGALPLLQYALTELYEMRTDRTLTKAAYQTIGGVRGALGRRAEEVFTILDPVGQIAAQQMFLRLVTLGEGTEDVRRRVQRGEVESLSLDNGPQTTDEVSVVGGLASAVAAFGKARLLTFDHDLQTRGPTLEVAHEALLREWPRLHQWLDENRADVRLQRQLAAETIGWLEADRDGSFLLRGSRLQQFEAWAQSNSVALTRDEHDFLDASVAERKATEAAEVDRQQRELAAAQRLAETERARADEQTQAAQRLRRRNRAIAAAGMLALLLAVLAVAFGAQANQNQALADEARSQAEKDKRVAVSRELAAAALNNLNVDPERSILLAWQAISTTDTLEAEDALHRAVQTSRLLKRVPVDAYDCDCSIAFSPDGTRLMSESFEGNEMVTQIRDAATLEVLFTKPGVWADDRWLYADRLPIFASGSDAVSPTLTVWDATGQNVITSTTLDISPSDVFAPLVDLSPDLTKLAVTGPDGYGYLYDVATGQRLQVIGKPDRGPIRLLFSPDGESLLTLDGVHDEMVLWDVTTGRELLTRPTPGPWLYDFSPDGQQFAVNENEVVKIVDVASGQDVMKFVGHTALVQGGLQFNADGTRLATEARDGTARIWDVATGQTLLTLPGHDVTWGVALSPDGTRLATVSAAGVQTWGIASSDSREVLTLPAAAECDCAIAFSPDGMQLAFFSGEQTVQVVDVPSGQIRLTFPDPGNQGLGLAFSPDGTRLATSGGDQLAHVWDRATGQELLTLQGHMDRVDRVIFSPDGTRLATISHDRTARLWDAASGQMLLLMQAYDDGDAVTENNDVGLAFSPDGARLATAGGSSIKIWDTLTGQEVLALPRVTELFAYTVAFSPDGKQLAVGFRWGTASVWDAATGHKLFDLSGHAASVLQIAYSPDGTRIATSSVDGTTRLWDAATGVEQLTLTGHTGQVASLAFSPGGAQLATRGGDGTASSVRIYALHLENLVKIAQARVTRSLTKAECQKYLHLAKCPAAP